MCVFAYVERKGMKQRKREGEVVTFEIKKLCKNLAETNSN
jgi:hypothetical protein